MWRKSQWLTKSTHESLIMPMRNFVYANSLWQIFTLLAFVFIVYLFVMPWTPTPPS
jgi:hypothetical protein